jgi:cytochrome c-type biogenesis protein CcmH/NrfG
LSASNRHPCLAATTQSDTVVVVLTDDEEARFRELTAELNLTEADVSDQAAVWRWSGAAAALVVSAAPLLALGVWVSFAAWLAGLFCAGRAVAAASRHLHRR